MMSVFGRSYDFNGCDGSELEGLVSEGYELLGIFNWSDHFHRQKYIFGDTVINFIAAASIKANSQIRKSHITSKFWGKCLNLRKTKLLMGTNRVLSVFPQSVLATDPTSKFNLDGNTKLQNNMLSNISGNASLPANVTVRLQGNPICLNTNLVLFCGPQNENETVSHTPSATNSNDNCLAQSCPYEYAPNTPCFCAAPLIVGYRLKSPGFRYFEPYWVLFEMYLTTGLKLNIFQLEIVSILWEEGPRLRMDLKIFPVYVDNTSSHIFNTTEVQRIRSMFTGWHIPDSEIFGPYELLDFPLRFPYVDVIPSSTSKSGISKGAPAGIVVGTVAGAVILFAVVSLLIWRLHMNKYTAVAKRRRCEMHSLSKTNVRAQVTTEVGNVNNKHFVLALKVKSMLDPCEDENNDIQDDDVSLGVDFVQRDEHSESISEYWIRVAFFTCNNDVICLNVHFC
ncbi:unnamed protein product [Camellia sinensis]